jgi:hypothetical protein
MAFIRVYEEQEVSADLRRIYCDIQASFDVAFVPTIFKVLAQCPEYLKAMWDDLGPVARSREFLSAATALDEYVQSLAVRGGWIFHDQQRILASQRFSGSDVATLGTVVATFARALPRLVLFSRLMQRGYSGGQTGHSASRLGSSKQAAALSRIVKLNIPNEKDAGLRVWLIYSDFKRVTGAANVPSIFRALAPFPGYLASVWVDTKRLLKEPDFLKAREDLNRRTLGLLVGLPVRDHRAARRIAPGIWREIEETVDGFARQLPQLTLAVAVWQRSFPQFTGKNFLAA